ncbi:MAG: hypothetical protein LBP92_15885 [Deltaproteobacteria bacterium]|jgi:hypothetical protein|nr:hypothetical protein [Deltaproteobacteria bacterium]
MMVMTDETPRLCADLVLTRVAERYASENKLTNTEALRRIMATKTYELLQDPESALCYESAESIYALLLDEESGDWDAWMKV